MEQDQKQITTPTSMEVDHKTNLPIDGPYDPFKRITKKKENWRFGVFVEDKWSVYKGDTEVTMELLLHDMVVGTVKSQMKC
ncbi:hypothetical protein P8452_02712 [Trifolium repens]|nr:hypothetical protein P8452_02712 [Trifolium repens]